MGAPATIPVAVVTGASSGLGWELARQLAAAGSKVALIARRTDKLQELAQLIQHAGGTAVTAGADVADFSSTQRAIAKVRDELGPIDLMVANAGVGIPTYLNPVNVADVETTFRVNVLGVVHSFAAVLPEMLQRRRGHLAAVSSLGGYLGVPGESAYCASKAAVNTYLDGLRVQLRGHGIQVTTLRPGFVRTPMTADFDFPMPGLMNADKAARLMIAALRSRRKIYDFPLICTIVARLGSFLPDWLLAYAVNDHSPGIAQDRLASPGSQTLSRSA